VSESESNSSNDQNLQAAQLASTGVDEKPEVVLERALFEVKKVVVGQDSMIERLMICVIANGHCLLEGPPGLAKTLAAKTLATVLGGQFARVQFTPDLLPADILGTRIYQPSKEAFDIELGPVFANVVLADEINRASPKVQSALLEVMAERQVSIAGISHPVPEPFIVLATQNPIESEGVYALPEAQQDRFLMKVIIDYPNDREEAEIVRRVGVRIPSVDQVLTPQLWSSLKTLAADAFVHDAVVDYAVRLVAATRRPDDFGLPEYATYIAYGASPRATLGLIAASRALALMRGRRYVLPTDVFSVAPEILRHRLVLSYEALANDVDAEQIIARLLRVVWAPQVSPGPVPTAPAPVEPPKVVRVDPPVDPRARVS
jgi:MoxR-like ATPase